MGKGDDQNNSHPGYFFISGEKGVGKPKIGNER